ncbi:hypothetical protein SAMN04488514_101474 [Kriegella aquimaris]|uniref:Uncharacterized protein n=1 Tax=Kriegella aquimaris TaxID=192904 RepID=A0A1G9JB87_9FLAO|nr:hypothetical protein SAMN04488514_101474 [Kriegella aquimaris]
MDFEKFQQIRSGNIETESLHGRKRLTTQHKYNADFKAKTKGLFIFIKSLN